MKNIFLSFLLLFGFSLSLTSQNQPKYGDDIELFVDSFLPRSYHYKIQRSNYDFFLSSFLFSPSDTIILGCKDNAVQKFVPAFRLKIYQQDSLIGYYTFLNYHQLGSSALYLRALEDYCYYGEREDYVITKDVFAYSESLEIWNSQPTQEEMKCAFITMMSHYNPWHWNRLNQDLDKKRQGKSSSKIQN